MDKSRQREIEKIAMDTVKACGSPEPLRNPVSICKHLGIPITTYTKDTADAYPDIYFSPAVTMNDDGVKTIVHAADCKSALPVAHELGHWILKHQKDGLIEESEADYFASILVAAKEPKPRIKRIAVSIIAAAVALALTASSAFMVGRASAPSEPAPLHRLHKTMFRRQHRASKLKALSRSRTTPSRRRPSQPTKAL